MSDTPPGGASKPYAVIAEFSAPERLVEAVRAARKAGFRKLDAFTPFPVDGLAEALGLNEHGAIGPVMLIGGIIGFLVAVGMQVGVALAFPLNVGGRPLISWPAYALICFELLVLFAVSFGVFAFLILNRLPKLHYPLFDVATFHLATADKFFLAIFASDPKFDTEAVRHFLAGQEPQRVDVAPDWEHSR